MWTNSNELLEHALRELKEAIENNKQEIEIVLDSNSIKGDILAIHRTRKKLRINKIIKIFEKQFPKYSMNSLIYGRDNVYSVMGRKIEPCERFQTLVWCLTLQKKA